MATVFLAIQESFQREVALKIMSPALSEDANFSDRFLREARIVSRLVHPNIVTVHDVGIENGHHYLSMEYIEGHDLKTCLPAFKGREIVRVMKEVAAALDYAGKKGYVHRDVKPENIMIHDQDGRAILMDFGIARAADAANSMTQTGTALGTPHYMSPEQARGHAIDGRSDLYSLGVLLYFMMVGEVPFDADSAVAIGIKHVSAKIPELPDGLRVYQPLIDKLLAKKPEQRFQSGAELLAALDQADMSPLDDYLSNPNAAPARSSQNTPVRNKAIPAEGLAAIESSTSKSSSPYRSPGAARAENLLAGEPAEALHIPREDLDGRLAKKTGGGLVIWFFLLLLAAAGSGYYAHNTGLITLPVNWLPDNLSSLLQLKMPDGPSTYSLQQTAAHRGAPAHLSAVDELANQSAVSQTGDKAAKGPGAETVNATGVSEVVFSVDALLAAADDLALQVADEPQKTGDLLLLYRQINALDPGHTEITSAYEAIKSQAMSVALNGNKGGDYAGAGNALDQALEWFPELAETAAYQNLRQSLDAAEHITKLLERADGYLQQDFLIAPAGQNARELFDQVLALDPMNEQGQQGLERVVARYLVLARGAKARADFNRAKTFINNGLQVDAGNTSLLDLREQLLLDQQKQQQIDGLLQSAQALSQRQQWFGSGENAIGKYQAALLLDPENTAASAGFSIALNEFVSEVDGLIAIKDYGLAEDRIQLAMESLPGNDRLILLAQQLESARPAIDFLQLSGQPIEVGMTAPLARFSAYRTLYITFEFKNLNQATTVFQARLFDAVRSTEIAAVPVVVVGEKGRTQFRIDRSVEGFSEGGYHIDILLAGKRIYSRAFVIDN